MASIHIELQVRNQVRGREAMFFSKNLIVPDVPRPLIELDRDISDAPRSVAERLFAI